MIDIHFHLLAGIDDGPASTAEMLELASAAIEGGTRTVVATPHLDEHWGVELPDIAAGVENARSALSAARLELEVVAGAEVSLVRYLGLSAEERGMVRFGQGHYVLIESPHASAAGNFDGVLARLLEQGQPVVLAHPERCPLFQRRIELLERLVDAGVLCSITAGSLVGRFGGPVREFTFELLERGLVHNVASDAHGAHRRGPDLLGALAEADATLPGLMESAFYFVESSPAAMLAGRAPEPPPRLERRRRGLLGGLRSRRF